MPYRQEWFPREPLLEHKDVLVFYDYKDGNRMSYWFTTDGEEDAKAFDVRKLSTYKKELGAGGTETEIIKRAVIAAIDAGELPE